MKETTRRQSLLSTIAVMCSTLSSRVLGFVRIALVSLYFGAKGEADVLNAVFAIPNNFRKLLAEGALSSAFIPELSQQIKQDPSLGESKRLSRSIMTLQCLILIPLSILAIAAPGFFLKFFIHFEDPAKLILAEKLFRWLFHYILLISISAVLMAILNSHNHFLVPALSPLLFSISVITSIVIWHDRFGIFSMVIGVLGGGLAQILWQYPLAFKLGYKLKPSFDFKRAPFQRVMKRWVPVLITSSIFTINQQVAILLATSLKDGSTSAFSNAIVFWQLPFGVFSASILTVLFPKMSRLAGDKNWDALSKTIQQGIQMLGLLLIPSSILLAFYGPHMISVALQRGAFYRDDTLLAARVLLAYAPGMIFVGTYNLLQRAFYSMGNYRYPLYCAIFTVILDILLSLLFIHLNLGVTSLAMANTIAFIGGALFLLIGIFKSHIEFDPKSFFIYFGKIFICQIPMILLCLFFRHIWDLSLFLAGSSWGNFGLLAIQGFSSLGLLFICYRLIGFDVVSILKRKG